MTRSIGLHVAIALLFAARIVCFLVMNQQFGIIPFVHLYSCLFICSFLDKAAMDTVRCVMKGGSAETELSLSCRVWMILFAGIPDGV